MKAISKIGILGGAFSPPTLGHFAMAQKVIDQGLVDLVWFSPCYSHNYNKEMINPDLRLEMCKLAIKGNDKINVNPFEIKQKIEGGTLVYIKALNKMFEPLNNNDYYGWEFKMIIGLDNANTFHKWANYKELMETVPFIVVSRKGIERDFSVDWYMKEPHYFLQSVEIPETSSTKVREIIKTSGYKKTGELLNLVNKGVLDFIIKNNLYKGE